MILLNQDFFDSNDRSVLLGIVMQDSEYIAQGFISPLTNFSKALFSFTFGIFFMWRINYLLTITLVPIAIFIGITISFLSGKFNKYAKEGRRRNTATWQYCTDTINGIRNTYNWE